MYKYLYLSRCKLMLIISSSLLALFIHACSNNPTSYEPVDPSERAIYSVNHTGISNHYKVCRASLDSLDNFIDIGFEFDLEHWLSLPANYISSKHRLYIVANFTKLYFIDTQTNKLIKEISLPFVGNFHDNFANIDRFLQYNSDYCILKIDKMIYMINLKNASIEETIFHGGNINPNLIIYGLGFTKEKHYLYLTTTTVGISNLSQQLYKVNMFTKNAKLIDQLASERTGLYSLGVSDDFVICAERQEIKKYSITNDELIMQDTLSDNVHLNFFYPWDNNNSLLCRDYISVDFYILDCNNLTVTKYWQLDIQYLYGDYMVRDSQLFCLVDADIEGNNQVLNLNSKNVALEFYNRSWIYVIHE